MRSQTIDSEYTPLVEGFQQLCTNREISDERRGGGSPMATPARSARPAYGRSGTVDTLAMSSELNRGWVDMDTFEGA